MDREILYTTAINEIGVLIHINNAEKGKDYFCPQCGNKFIIKKSGKTGKGSKRPHFAHNILTHNCTPEGVLHYSFKIMAVDLLNYFLINKKPFNINWNCRTCGIKNEGNLLAKVSTIKEEYNLKVCQPDIALLDSNGNIIAAIEIVVTHSPEYNVLQYYRDNKILLFQINLSSDEDLKFVREKISTPDIVDFCLNPNCANKKLYSIIRRIGHCKDRCSNCIYPIEIFFIETNSFFGIQRMKNFTDKEISFIKSKFKHILVNTDNSTGAKYPISICLNCKQLKFGRRAQRL